MDPRLTSELAALVGEFQQLSAALTAGQEAADAGAEGVDARLAVNVRVDAGGRVSSVRPRATWRSKIEPEELGAAVLEAVQAAQRARVERWATAMVEADQGPPPEPPTAPEPAPDPEPPPEAPAVNPALLLGELMTMFESLEKLPVTQAMPDAEPATKPASRVRLGTHVRVTVSAAGEVVEVWIDPHWAGEATLTRLSSKILAAFRTAYDAIPPAEDPFPISEELAAVAADPGASLQRFATDLAARERQGRNR